MELSKENPLVKHFEELAADSVQLAKHREGRYEWIVSLPAKSKSADEATTGQRSSTQDKKVHFGCTLVRDEGNSELVRRNRSDSGNTYTLIASPIETPLDEEDRPSTETVELVFDKTVKTAIPAITEADDVKSLHGMIEEAKRLVDRQHTVSPPASHTAQGLDGAAEIGSSPSSTLAEPDADSEVQSSPPLENIFEKVPTVDRIGRGGWERHGSCDMHYHNSQDQNCSNQSAISSSRIEDAVEALDEFEEQFEAISEATQFDRVLPAEGIKQPMPSLVMADKPTTRLATTAVAKRTPRKSTSTFPHGRPAEGAALACDPSTMSRGQVREQKHARPSTAPKRLSVSKPASLQPPKLLARTVKPPTTSTFELPGDAVARRLKEKREARLTISTPSQAPRRELASPSKAKVTRPNFELPGEAISRRKREEREAKLKAQEEEERKRREFKARPVRTNITFGNLSYRETAASRARKSVVQAHNESRTPPANKRQSLAATIHGRPSLSRPALGLNTGPKISSASKASSIRARRSIVMSDQDFPSRQSPSPGVGVSAQERQAQKKRGRAIYEEDNKAAVGRTRERAENVVLHKSAKKQAVERAKQANLECEEKMLVDQEETPEPELGGDDNVIEEHDSEGLETEVDWEALRADAIERAHQCTVRWSAVQLSQGVTPQPEPDWAEMWTTEKGRQTLLAGRDWDIKWEKIEQSALDAAAEKERKRFEEGGNQQTETPSPYIDPPPPAGPEEGGSWEMEITPEEGGEPVWE